MSMKNSSDTNGNQNRDLPACSAVSQPTAPPRAPVVVVVVVVVVVIIIIIIIIIIITSSSKLKQNFIFQFIQLHVPI